MRLSTDKVKSFANEVINESFIEQALGWASTNVDPEDVFDEADLANCAINNGYEERKDW